MPSFNILSHMQNSRLKILVKNWKHYFQLMIAFPTLLVKAFGFQKGKEK